MFTTYTVAVKLEITADSYADAMAEVERRLKQGGTDQKRRELEIQEVTSARKNRK